MKDNVTLGADPESLAGELKTLSETLEKVLARLESLEEKPSATKALGKQSHQLLDAVTDLIEAHPVRATVIGFLLGALLFRGRH